MDEQSRRVADDPTPEQVVRGCTLHILGALDEALGDGEAFDNLVAAVIEEPRDPPLPPGMVATTVDVFRRNELLAEYDQAKSEGMRLLAAALRAWRAPGPNILPVIFVVGDAVGIASLRAVRVPTAEGGDA